ncbi:MAG: 50S ribosomal protein L17 [Acidobacteria bacterium RIFCSPLOWO2_12_FULL_66_10]|nr:MAG: 50S ribosomal protein L17 [Acidobacteria bacterium RIFCSPLOWO2_12_FULL_66_10]
MRHRNAHRKLGRTSSHRTALLRNQAEALLAHESIETTVPKAKELRPYVERLITIAKRGVKANDPKGVSLSARRLVMRDVLNEDVVTKLFDELAPRFMERPGGYTRILKLGHRRGDAAEVAQIELVGSEFDPKKAEAEKKAAEEAAGSGEQPKSQKSVGERLKAAAKSIRGGGQKGKGGGGAKSRAGKPARGASKQTSTPRKAGGS